MSAADIVNITLMADHTSQTWAVLAGIEFAALAFFTAWLLRFFAAKNTPWLACITVFVSWYFGFFGTLFLPIDIAEAYWNSYVNVTNVTDVTNGTEWNPNEWNGLANATVTWTVSTSPTPSLTLTPSGSFGASVSVSPSLAGTPSGSRTASATAARTPSGSVTPPRTPSSSLSRSQPPSSSRPPSATRSPPPVPSSSPTPLPIGGGGGDGEVVVDVPDGDVVVGRRALWGEANRDGVWDSGSSAGMQRVQRVAGLRPGREPSWAHKTVSHARRLASGALSYSHLYRWLQSGSSSADASSAPSPYPLVPGLNCTNGTDALAGPPRLVPLCNASQAGNGTEGDGGWEIVTERVVMRNGPLERMWWVVYWVTAVLTYVLIPVVQEYVAAGEFTRRARLRTAIVVNLVFYAVIAVLAAGGLVYVLFFAGMKLAELIPIGITAANTYGLVLVVLLIGYGSAEVPRSLWQASNAAGELRRQEFAAPEVEATVFDARTQLQDVCAAVRQAAARVGALESSPAFQSGVGAEELAEVKRCLAIVQAKAILEQDALGSGGLVTPLYNGGRGGLLGEEEEEGAGGGGFGLCGKRNAKVSDAKKLVGVLAGLHKKLMQSSAKLARTQFRWDRLVRSVTELEHVLERSIPALDDPHLGISRGHGPGGVGRARGASMYWGRGAQGSANPGSPEGDINVVDNSVGARGLCGLVRAWRASLHGVWWTWRIWVAPYAYLLFALTAEALSLLLIWSECTIWVNLQNLVTTNLSVFGLMLTRADSDSHHSYFAIQVVAAIPLAYMCLTSAFALFKLKLFDIHDLSGNRNTDAYSLCVNAALFNRMQFALAFNYLNVLMHSTDRTAYPQPAFSYSVGANMRLSLVDWYLPMLTGVIYVLCRINLWERIMRLMGVDEKGSPVAGNPRHEETIAEGRKLIEKAKKQMAGGGGAGGAGGREPAAAGGGRGVGSTGPAGGRGGKDVELGPMRGSGTGATDRGPAPGIVASSSAGSAYTGAKKFSLDSFAGSGASSSSGPTVVVVGSATASGGPAGAFFSSAFSGVSSGMSAINTRRAPGMSSDGEELTSGLPRIITEPVSTGLRRLAELGRSVSATLTTSASPLFTAAGRPLSRDRGGPDVDGDEGALDTQPLKHSRS